MTAHKNLARTSLSQFTATSIAMEAQRWSTSWAIHFCDLNKMVGTLMANQGEVVGSLSRYLQGF